MVAAGFEPTKLSQCRLKTPPLTARENHLIYILVYQLVNKLGLKTILTIILIVSVVNKLGLKTILTIILIVSVVNKLWLENHPNNYLNCQCSLKTIFV